jgi:hypothetical protein
LSTMGHLATTSDGTASGIIVGTVPYMAPEQVEGKDADARTDLWALGVVFYEMVTATAPFKGQTPASVIGAILRDDPVPLSQSTAAVSPLIDQVIARCLEKDPVDRWQSAADVHHALAITMHAAADGAPTSDARNASRRYKGLWAAVAMLALAIAILTPGWMAHIQEPAAGVARLSLELPPNLTLSAPPALTTDVTNDASAVWSPDGREIVFRSNRLGRSDAFKKRASGSSAEERWFGEGSNLIVTDWSIDGRYVLYATGSTSGFELRAWPTNSGGQPIVAGRSRLNAIQGRLSPDGKWLAYASDESGRWQVYVQPFPPTGDTKTISADGGSEPRWRRDGRELFFLAADMRLMSVELSGGALSAGAPKPLFETRAPLSGNPYRVNYAVSRDGRRFLVNAKVGERTRATLRVLQNWQALLEP